jgi:beta-galactosidase
VDRKFVAVADDHELRGDGADTTRIVLRVTDEFDRIRPIANDPIVFELSGPGRIIGDNPFALGGGTGAIWIRATEQAGTIVLRAKHPRLGTQQIEIKVAATAPENV